MARFTLRPLLSCKALTVDLQIPYAAGCRGLCVRSQHFYSKMGSGDRRLPGSSLASWSGTHNVEPDTMSQAKWEAEMTAKVIL